MIGILKTRIAISILVISGTCITGMVVLAIGRNKLSGAALLAILLLLYVFAGALGEVLSYTLGLAGHSFDRIERSRMYQSFYFLVKKYIRQPSLVAAVIGFINSLTPIGFMPAVAGIIAGTEKYSVVKFAAATIAGRMVGASSVLWIFGERVLAASFCKFHFFQLVLGNICA